MNFFLCSDSFICLFPIFFVSKGEQFVYDLHFIIHKNSPSLALVSTLCRHYTYTFWPDPSSTMYVPTFYVRAVKAPPRLRICAGTSESLCFAYAVGIKISYTYEGCSNMNASSFITFFTYMLRQNAIPFWKELFIAFKMAPNIKTHSLYFLSYRPLYKGHSCILKFFEAKYNARFGTRADIVSYLCQF